MSNPDQSVREQLEAVIHKVRHRLHASYPNEAVDELLTLLDQISAERETAAYDRGKLMGAIEQLQKTKQYYGRPMYGGIDKRIALVRRKLDALPALRQPTGEESHERSI